MVPTDATALLRRLETMRPGPGSRRVRQAMALAQRLYEGKTHWTGVSMMEHIEGVLEILLPFQPDDDAICACLLHHMLELHAVSVTELEEEFGLTVRSLISSIHLLSHVTMRNRKSSIDDLRLMLMNVSDDVRVLLVILCDRAYVLRHLPNVSATERKHIARDVLRLFAPVAARLGIHSLKQQLESLAFPLVYPLDAEWIADQLKQAHARHGLFLEKAAQELSRALREQGIDATIQAREKQPYSIFRKIHLKSLSTIEHLPDLFALRVIVPTEEDCYRVLGTLHRMGRPLPNRFKDYIAFPKPNGYKSLHTTVARLPGVPNGLFVEVQVRTQQMHREAEFGIAAHWSYKEGGTAEQAMQRVQLQQMLTSQQAVEAKGSKPHLADHIFVLTPKGDIVELPEGATPLDFAFQIHTELGLTFRAARVNGAIVPLDYELENGDSVEVLTHRVPQPSPEWLQLLKMASSRSRLKRYLYSLDRTHYIDRGREILNQELAKRGLPPLDGDLGALRRFDGHHLSFGDREDLLMKVGQRSDKPGTMLLHLDLLKAARVARAAPPAIVRLQRKDALIEIEGGVPLPLKFAKCCKPQEGDRGRIVGIIGRGGQVTVHASKCRMAQNGNPERRVGLRWRKST